MGSDCSGCGPSAVWCDTHGDLWWADDGGIRYGNPPPERNGERRPFDQSHPIIGLRVMYRRDDGVMETRGFHG
jgi:hypothetical protein